MTQNVAEMMVSVLDRSGVRRIYGLIGDSLNPIGDAVRRNRNIRWIAVRHEEAAAFAAAGEAFMTGKLCVCAGTSGPGSIHMLNGLYEANKNRAPVLAIVTHIPRSETGLDYFQETSPMRLYEDCSLFCETVSHPSQMPRLMQAGMQKALSEGGVAVLIVPKDVSEAPAEENAFLRPIEPTPAALVPDAGEIRKLADIINVHEKITFYCGIGCCHAKQEVLNLAETLKAPTVCTIRSRDFMESDNPNDAGMNGLLSLRESRAALRGCDLLILLGTDFPYPAALPVSPTVVQIDINAGHLGRRGRLDFGIQADVKAALDLLLPLLREKKDAAHLRESLEHKRKIDEEKQKDLEKMAAAEPLRPEYLTHMLSRVADEETVFAVDVGLCTVWAARYIKAEGRRRLIGSFRHGSMAAAIPEAMGAWLGAEDPGRPFVVLAGDGGFAMLMGELLTLVQHRIPLKIIVYNNGELGYINFEAELARMPPFKTELLNPDFARLAEAAGLKSFRITSPEGLEDTLRQALDAEGPVLIDALTDPAALP